MRPAAEIEEPTTRTPLRKPARKPSSAALLEACLLAATALYAVWFAVHYRAVYDPDIWWHLRAGDWILLNHALPRTDWLSSTAAGKPWVVYSWGFEVLVAALYRGFGLFGPIIVYPVTMALFIVSALWMLVSESSLEVWARASLVAAGVVAMAPIFSPRPGLFSVLLFILELWLILRAERMGSDKPLYLLPVIFALWANIHIQFIYGIFVAGLYAAEPWIQKSVSFVIPGAARDLRFSSAAITNSTRWRIFGLCALATLLNPYTYKLYVIIAQLARQTGQYSYISELQSPSFRSYNSFAELLLLLAAWFVLGWRRAPRWISAVLLLVATVFAFRAVRDVWFGVLAAVFAIVLCQPLVAPKYAPRTFFAKTLTTLAVLCGVLLIGRLHPLSNHELWQDTSEEFPVKAVAYVKQHNLPGPLYNDWYWGGFLTCNLPDIPVYVDSRTNLFGDRTLQRSIATWSGASDWASDPGLSNANLVIASTDSALTSLLRFDPRFRAAFEDARAVVFVSAK